MSAGVRPTKFGGQRVVIADVDGLIPIENLPPIPAATIPYDPTASGLTADDVQEAIDELAADDAAHLADPTDAHDASAVSVADAGGHWTATDVEAVLQEIPKVRVTTTDPTTGDDSGDGYAVGSRWINITSAEEFVATDVSVGSAVWVSTTDAGSGSVPNGTDPGDLLVWDGAAYDVLPIGTDGDVLTADSGEALGLIYATPSSGGGGGGGLVLLEEHIASASSSLDFTTRNAAGQSGATFQSDFDDYQIEVRGLIPATNSAILYLRVSTDGGSSYDAGANYHWGHVNKIIPTGTVGVNGQTSTSAWKLFTDSGDSAGISSSFPFDISLTFRNPLGSTHRKSIYGQGIATYATGPNIYLFSFGGIYVPTTAVDAFRVIMSTGNITAGVVRVYGREMV